MEAHDSSEPRSEGKGSRKGKNKGKGKSKKGDQGPSDKARDEGFGTMRREGWPKDRPDYLYFRLYKELGTQRT